MKKTTIENRKLKDMTLDRIIELNEHCYMDNLSAHAWEFIKQRNALIRSLAENHKTMSEKDINNIINIINWYNGWIILKLKIT